MTITRFAIGKSLCILIIVGLLAGSRIVPATGAVSVAGSDVLRFIEAKFDNSGLASPFSVAVSPDGKQVCAASFTDDTVAVFGQIYTVYLLLVVRN